MDFKTNLETE